jgi:hypothetical protein
MRPPLVNYGWNPIETAPLDEDIALQVTDGRTGHVMPIIAARRMYSPIAIRPIPTDRAILRSLAPQAYSGVKLLPGIGPPVVRIAKGGPSSDRRQRSPPHPINRVAAFVRWPLCLGFRTLYVGHHET